MMPIVVFLDAKRLDPYWVKEGQLHVGDLTGLQEASKLSPLIAVIPASDVMLTTIQLPAMSAQHLKQALPYALEDHVLADIETLHMAYTDADASGARPVAVIARERMQFWQATLASMNLVATTLRVMTHCLPYQAPAITLSDISHPIVRLGDYAGFAADHAWLAASLEPWLIPGAHMTLYTQQADDVPRFAKDGVTVQTAVLDESAYYVLCAHAAIYTPGINLFQGDFAVKTKKAPIWTFKVKPVVALLAIWVVAVCLNPMISYCLLAPRLHALDRAMQMIYQKHFPEASAYVAPKQRLQEKWHRLLARHGDMRAFLYLARVNKAMQALDTSVTIKQIDYHQQQMTLAVMTHTSGHLTAFTDALKREGFSVKEDNATVSDNEVRALLRLV